MEAATPVTTMSAMPSSTIKSSRPVPLNLNAVTRPAEDVLCTPTPAINPPPVEFLSGAALVICPSTSNVPPMCAFLAIPTPPSTINAPVVLLVDCVASSMLTAPEDVTAPVTFRVEPSNVRLPLSSREPAVPANTTRPDVRSDTVADARVDSPVTPSVPPTVALPIIPALASTSNVSI